MVSYWLIHRVKSLSKGGNTRKEQTMGPTRISSRESSLAPSFLSAEAEEIPTQIQEKKPVDTYRKDPEIFASNSEPDKNSFSTIPNYSNRGRRQWCSIWFFWQGEVWFEVQPNCLQ
jgi:kinesin family member 2/24